MGNHHPSVHSRIGAPCAHYLYPLAKQCGEALLQHFLHRDAIGLDLPSVVTRSVVTQMYEVALHAIHLLPLTARRNFFLWNSFSALMI